VPPAPLYKAGCKTNQKIFLIKYSYPVLDASFFFNQESSGLIGETLTLKFGEILLFKSVKGI
jgi:hypothetical protein